MSTPVEAGLFALGGVALGAVIATISAILLYRWQRKDALVDRQYHERSDAYVAFISAAHDCAHQIGKLAQHDEHAPGEAELPSAAERMKIAYDVDAFAARHVRFVEIVGPPAVEEAARAVLDELYDFRDALQRATRSGSPVVYSVDETSQYMALLEPYRAARKAFTRAAKAELARLSTSVG
jgi:hypothetical protein